MEDIDFDTLYDPQLVSQVLHYTDNGWPKYATGVPENLRPYRAVRGDMSVADGKLIATASSYPLPHDPIHCSSIKV